MSLGTKLAELRNANGYSARELANKIGVSQSSISLWESNNRRPDFDKLKSLANLYGVSVDYLLGNDGVDIETRSDLSLLNEQRNDLEIEKNILKKKFAETSNRIKSLEAEMENDTSYKFTLIHSISQAMLHENSNKKGGYSQKLIDLINLKIEQTEKMLENENIVMQDINNQLAKNSKQLDEIYQLIDQQRGHIDFKHTIKGVNVISKMTSNRKSDEDLGKFIIDYLGLTDNYNISGLSIDEYLFKLKRQIKNVM